MYGISELSHCHVVCAHVCIKYSKRTHSIVKVRVVPLSYVRAHVCIKNVCNVHVFVSASVRVCLCVCVCVCVCVYKDISGLSEFALCHMCGVS